MKRAIVLLCFLAGLAATVPAQTPSKYWVQFTDKRGTPFSAADPSAFLSPRAVALRRQRHIAIDESDLPVSPQYVAQVMSLDTGMRLCTQSRWLNGITVYSEREGILGPIQSLPCVSFAERTVTYREPEPRRVFDSLYKASGPAVDMPLPGMSPGGSFRYGRSAPQVMLNNAHWLHRMGFTGKGVRMMLLDGGFANADRSPAFASMRAGNRLMGCRNIARPDENPLREHTHGTMALSCIAAYMPGKMIGTAPMVQVFLCETEDSRYETKTEEDNWVAGLELADSLGCQVVNSSLGYTTFGDSMQPRSYKDMDGRTSRASAAASIAASKGMIVCVSAGNSGAGPWKYISSPADADGILAAGAVDARRRPAPFSSKGPTADGRVKPDACTAGWHVIVTDEDGDLRTASGTSFAAPMLAGMTACLQEAFPNADNHDIMNAIRKSGDRYGRPDNRRGYGIPDLLHAYNLLLQPEDPALTFHFRSFVTEKHKLTVKVKSKHPVTLHFDCSIRNSRKRWTQTVRAHLLKTVRITVPQLPESLHYALVDLHVTTDDGRQFDFVAGTDNPEHK